MRLNMTNEHGSLRRIYQNPEMDEPVWLCDPCQKAFATNYSLRQWDDAVMTTELSSSYQSGLISDWQAKYWLILLRDCSLRVVRSLPFQPSIICFPWRE